MTPEERAKLDRALHLAEENNKLLLSLRRTNRVAIGMRVLYWVIIIGLTFGAFYFVQPYLNFFSSLTGNLNPSSQNRQGTTTDSTWLETLQEAQESARGLEKLLR